MRQDPLDALVADADVLFHLAAMPGLVRSWTDFGGYWTCNVQATQCLLEAVWDILRMLETVTGRSVVIRQEPARPGDQRYTFADTAKIRRHFGWEPRIRLDEGLTRQWEWQRRELAERK